MEPWLIKSSSEFMSYLYWRFFLNQQFLIRQCCLCPLQSAQALSSIKRRVFTFHFPEKNKKTSSCCFSIQSATKYESKDKTHKEFANWDELMRHGIRNFEHRVSYTSRWPQLIGHLKPALIYWARLLPFTRAHNSVVIPIDMAETITLRSQTWFGPDEMKLQRPERLCFSLLCIAGCFQPCSPSRKDDHGRGRDETSAQMLLDGLTTASPFS